MESHCVYPVRKCIGTCSDKSVQVEIDKCSNKNLTVHSVSHSAMAWNQVREILSIEGFTLILIDLLSPEAKNPPNGPMILANIPNTMT